MRGRKGELPKSRVGLCACLIGGHCGFVAVQGLRECKQKDEEREVKENRCWERQKERQSKTRSKLACINSGSDLTGKSDV